MALQLVQAHKHCQQLLAQATQQLSQELNIDPLSSLTLEKLNSTASGVKKAVAKLEEEGTVFEGIADLSGLEGKKLQSLLSDIREASRKLSIVLAAGANQFKGKAKTDVQVVNQLKPYIDSSISNMLKFDDIVTVLQCGTAQTAHANHYGYDCSHTHPDVASITSITCTQDFGRGNSAAETMKKLAGHFSAFAKKCEQICADREKYVRERDDKARVQRDLIDVVTKLAPLLRKHVLRIGIAKGQHLNISNGCGNVATITNLFDYATVENAHRELEDCRDRILQELTLRKLESKMQQERTPERCPEKRRKCES